MSIPFASSHDITWPDTNIGGAEVRVEYEPVGHIEGRFGTEVEEVEHVLASQCEIEESYGEFFLWMGGGDRFVVGDKSGLAGEVAVIIK